MKKTYCFSVVSHPTRAQVPICIAKMKIASKKDAKSTVFLTFQITRTRKYRFLHLTLKKMGTLPDPADPPDPAEAGHEASCTTPGTLAPEVRMTVVLNKLPQTIFQISWKLDMPFGQGTAEASHVLCCAQKPKHTRPCRVVHLANVCVLLMLLGFM